MSDFDISRFSPVGGESTDGGRVYSYQTPTDQTISDIMDELSVQSLLLGHPTGYFDDLADIMSRGDLLILLDPSAGVGLPKMQMLLCTGSGRYSDNMAYCRFTPYSDSVFEELSGTSSAITGYSLANKSYYYDGTTYDLTIEDDVTELPYQAGTTFTVYNNGSGVFTVDGDTGTATFNGDSFYEVNPGNVATFTMTSTNEWIVSQPGAAGPAGGGVSYAEINQPTGAAGGIITISSGTEQIERSGYLGAYVRITATGAITLQVEDDSPTWVAGDTVDIWGVSDTGGPHTLTITGQTGAADFNENGNIGSSSFVATKTQGVLIRLVYLGSNVWDVWEIYI